MYTIPEQPNFGYVMYHPTVPHMCVIKTVLPAIHCCYMQLLIVSMW